MIMRRNNNLNIAFYQSNIEGEIVNKIQESRNNIRMVLLLTLVVIHILQFLLDSLMILKKPSIELHITNIYKREDFRHKSLISGVVLVLFVVLELKVIY